MFYSGLRKYSPRCLVAVAVTTLVVAAQCSVSPAATITWGTPVAISGVGDSIVSTVGTPHSAINFDINTVDGNMPRTVNSVTFTAQTSTLPGWNVTAPTYGSDLYQNGNVSADFERMLDSFLFGNGALGSAAANLTLSGLTLDEVYQVQFFVSDDRTTNDFNLRTQNFTGGANTSSTTANGFSYSLLGTFTADATSQVITVTGFAGGTNPNGSPIINAYQVRLVPEPANVLLVGLGIAGVMAIARRQATLRRP